MAALLATLRRRTLAVPLARALATVDRFPEAGGARRAQLERIMACFLRGYERALEEREPGRLGAALEEEPAADRGFSYEGAGMGLALVDVMAPRAFAKLRRFTNGTGAPHRYMVLVGAGWAHARSGFARVHARRRLLGAEPLLGWLGVDGEGFHDGFFHADEVIGRGQRSAVLAGYERRAYDQGVGRSLWFFDAADRMRIPETIARFADERRGDLWGGVGLACAYAAGEAEALVRGLLEHAGEHRSDFAQGVAFAVEARVRAGNPTAECERVGRLVWGLPGEELAGQVALALHESGAHDGAAFPRYEAWRAAMRRRHGALAGVEDERTASVSAAVALDTSEV